MNGIIWEYRQNKKISEARNNANKVGTYVRELEQKLEKLNLICASMWELLKEKTELTEQDLVKKIIEVDREDGKIDGKKARKAILCKKCDRPISTTLKKCLFCGTEYPEDEVPPF
jgi:hypothetical protein